jgi:hypothetical protein
MAVGIVPTMTSRDPYTPEKVGQLLREARQKKSEVIKGVLGFAGDACSKAGREDIVSCGGYDVSTEGSGRANTTGISSEPMESLFKLLDEFVGWLKSLKRTEAYPNKEGAGQDVAVPKRIDAKS